MVGDPSREDAAADARPRRVQPGAGAALVDDHGVTLDTAVGVVVADVEKAVRGDRRRRARLVVLSGQPLLQLDASVLSMAKRTNPRSMRSEVSAEGVVGRGMAYRWESGACAKVRPLKSWQMKPAGGSYPGRDTLYGI